MPGLAKSDGAVIAEKVELALSMLSQTAGLMFRKKIPESYALVMDMAWDQRTGVHMLFVRFPIDVVFLDSAKTVVDARKCIRPWMGMAYSRQPARYIIETNCGAIEKFGIKPGDVLTWG